jgi:hypothetical protein
MLHRLRRPAAGTHPESLAAVRWLPWLCLGLSFLIIAGFMVTPGWVLLVWLVISTPLVLYYLALLLIMAWDDSHRS